MEDRKKILPLLPLRDIVVFPHMVVPLFIGRDKSIAALEAALSHERLIFLAAQRDAGTNEPGEEDIFRIGTVAHIVQILKLPDGTVKVLVDGRFRARLLHFLPGPIPRRWSATSSLPSRTTRSSARRSPPKC
jgi:ATP-dependent Lon protease